VSEVRIVNEQTGGEKGQKIERYDLIPWEAMDEVARVYGLGAEKYSENNFRKGYAWSLSFASMMRHATQFWAGESYDKETGAHHLACAVFHALALIDFEKNYPELDDRYKKGEVK